MNFLLLSLPLGQSFYKWEERTMIMMIRNRIVDEPFGRHFRASPIDHDGICSLHAAIKRSLSTSLIGFGKILNPYSSKDDSWEALTTDGSFCPKDNSPSLDIHILRSSAQTHIEEQLTQIDTGWLTRTNWDRAELLKQRFSSCLPFLSCILI